LQLARLKFNSLHIDISRENIPFNESLIFSDIITVSSVYAFGLIYNENGKITKLPFTPDIP
jgi:hypothetical protein